jgi:hypothetical protein
MSALDFVTALLEGGGRVRVGPDPLPASDLAGAAATLDAAVRPTLAFEPPPLSVPAGEWAILVLHRACQALVYREIDGSAVRAGLALACPVPPSPRACYSVDLAFQFLPELTSLARGIAEDDPLVAGLHALAEAWPLSSVGVRGLREGLDVSPFIDDPCLRRLYADRVIERKDLSRLTNPAARDAVRESLGEHRYLAKEVAAVAFETEKEQACP